MSSGRNLEDKFTVVSNYVIDQFLPKIGPRAFCLYVLLRKFSRYDTGDCYPKINTLANILGVSRRTISTLLKSLEDCGLIYRQSGKNSGRGNHYTVMLEKTLQGDLLQETAYPWEAGFLPPEKPTSYPNKEELEPYNTYNQELFPDGKKPKHWNSPFFLPVRKAN